MSPASARAIASVVVSIMSFLGWSGADYAKYLPKEIQSQIILELPIAETIATSTTPTKTSAPKKQTTKKQTTPTATMQTKQKAPAIEQAPKPIALPSVQISQPQTVENFSQSEKINKATVNILCSMQRGNMIEKFTGSGVVIDPSGIIITNAHIAEHVMLAEAGYESCNIRTGSPAKNSYKAKVIYLPDIWIQNNRNNLSMQSITGTGENDYALLLITERTSIDAPNVPLVYLSPSNQTVSIGDGIILAGYPAGFGDAALLDSALYLLQKPSQITNAAGFNGTGADVINTSPTSLAEHGSSGGAVAGSDGSLVGIIVAVTIDNYTSQKNIQAITLSYIRNSIQNNFGKSFDYFLSNAQTESKNFETTKAASHSAILMQGL